MKTWKDLAIALANENHHLLCQFQACTCGCVERRIEITSEINRLQHMEECQSGLISRF